MSNSHVFNFAKSEEEILEYWDQINAFHKSNELHKDFPKFTFFDGPPFATGLPHYGHILAGTIKDVVTRWNHLLGYSVERRFGWDCHGLPVEYEIDKSLGIKSGAEVEEMGIGVYNDHCRRIVMRYSGEWELTVRRLGRWIDFENDYKTMYPWFMESVWWVFKELFNKGFIYKSFKVMPYSNACHTPLSNFESGLNYKDVQDPSVVVRIPLRAEKVDLLIWTTTPWTIVSMLLVCVHPSLIYCKVRHSGRCYVLLESRIRAVLGGEFEILEKFEGVQLEGKQFFPPFDYFRRFESRGAFKVVCDEYVTSEVGTGLVQQAPFFGEDDFRIATKHGVISSTHMACPIDPSGNFTEEVPELCGLYFQNANKKVIQMLRERGLLQSSGTITHNYPFCWRSDTPLMYRAVSTIFVNVESVIPQLLESNRTTYWVPDFVKHGRFANWLSNARDWAISRDRYWGTPIPMWVSEDGQEVVVVGSVEELYQLSGVRVTDIHRETVDPICIPSRTGRGVLKRIPQVFDCWFESGSMPYAQSHYPFEGRHSLGFPADFVAEGIDQTRGWFYTLMVLSTILFGRAPFRNLICNGLILAEDGQKMSKRKKNYPDPLEVISKYGADALRCYLINSPAVNGDNLRFKEAHVQELHRTFFIPFHNSLSIMLDNITRLNRLHPAAPLSLGSVEELRLSNILDRYVISATQTLVGAVHRDMSEYKLYRVVSRFLGFIEILTNVYIRLSRDRLKGVGEDSKTALAVLFNVILTTARVFSPFSPFFTEHIFQKLRKVMKDSTAESIHHVLLPHPIESLVDRGTEDAVNNMITLLELSRQVRTREKVPLKCPVELVYVVDKRGGLEQQMRPVMHYIHQEVNTFSLVFTTDLESLSIRRIVKPDYRKLGPRYKSSLADIARSLGGLTDGEFDEGLRLGFIDLLGGIRVAMEELLVSYEMSSGDMPDYSVAFEGSIGIVMKCSLSQDCKDYGMAREVSSRIQKMRKEAKLTPTDPISLSVVAPGERMTALLRAYRTFIQNRVGLQLHLAPMDAPGQIISETFNLSFHGETGKNSLCISIYPQVETANGFSSLFADVVPRDGSPGCSLQLFYPEFGRSATLDEISLQMSRVFPHYAAPVLFRYDGEEQWNVLAGDGLHHLLRRKCFLSY